MKDVGLTRSREMVPRLWQQGLRLATVKCGITRLKSLASGWFPLLSVLLEDEAYCYVGCRIYEEV